MVEKVELIILGHEDKTSKGDPPKDYTRFKCKNADGSEKWRSAFDKDIIEDLKKHENRKISVDIADTESFCNLRKFHGAIPGGPTIKELDTAIEEADEIIEEFKEVPIVDPKTMKPKETKDQQGTSFYTSYAKDIFVAIIKDNCGDYNTCVSNMKLSIDLVKQARKAFS